MQQRIDHVDKEFGKLKVSDFWNKFKDFENLNFSIPLHTDRPHKFVLVYTLT